MKMLFSADTLAAAKNLIIGAVGSLIAAALWSLGSYLSTSMVSSETALQYETLQRSVRHTSIWYLRISNPTDFAFEVSIHEPPFKTVHEDFFPRSRTAGMWNGSLQRGRYIEAIFVLDSANAKPSGDTIEQIIDAKYLDRNPLTGEMEWRQANLHDPDATSIPRGLEKVLWFLSPLFGMGLLLFLGFVLLRKRKSKSDQVGHVLTKP